MIFGAKIQFKLFIMEINIGQFALNLQWYLFLGAKSDKIGFSNTVIESSGEIQVGVSRGDFHFFEVFSPKVHLWVYEDEGGRPGEASKTLSIRNS